ncbi:hypothetical protein ROS1_11110 [Roseibium sp. ROS1]
MVTFFRQGPVWHIRAAWVRTGLTGDPYFSSFVQDILTHLREIVAGAFNIRIVGEGRESETKNAGHT